MGEPSKTGNTNKKANSFLQPKPVNNKWKAKRKSGIFISSQAGKPPLQQHFQPRALFFWPVQPPPLQNPAMLAPKFHPSASKKRLRRRRLLPRGKLHTPNAPLAPRNTTSFIIRAKNLGGIAPAITPSPATPAVLPTPAFSPRLRYKGSPKDMNKELGVDGYGSMNGLIRLRAYERHRDAFEGESDVDQGEIEVDDQSVQSVARLEQRIDQGLSRFEMIYPSGSSRANNAPRDLENCVDSQEGIIARLEEENLTLKERLFLVEQEVNELRRRLGQLEARNCADEPMLEHCEESCGDASGPSTKD